MWPRPGMATRRVPGLCAARSAGCRWGGMRPHFRLCTAARAAIASTSSRCYGRCASSADRGRPMPDSRRRRLYRHPCTGERAITFAHEPSCIRHTESRPGPAAQTPAPRGSTHRYRCGRAADRRRDGPPSDSNGVCRGPSCRRAAVRLPRVSSRCTVVCRACATRSHAIDVRVHGCNCRNISAVSALPTAPG